MNRARPEAEAEGVPTLELRDEDREAVAELLADVLVAEYGHLRPVTLPGIKRLLVDRADLDALIVKAKAR